MNPVEQLLQAISERNLWQEDRVYARKELLKNEGAVDTNIYWVVDGSLRIFFRDGEDENIIRLGYSGNLITALDSFITEKPSPIIIDTIKKSHIKSVSKKVFMEMINSDIELKNIWTQGLMILVHQQLEREIDILSSSPKDRYFRVLQRSPQLFQEVPHKYIASYLRMTPETLSRIKKS